MSDPGTGAHLQARRARERAKRNRDRARKQLLAQRRELQRRHEGNRARADTTDEADDRNPTTHSTVPPGDDAADTAARSAASTVPHRPRYSAVSPSPRLYGLGLYRAAGGDSDG